MSSTRHRSAFALIAGLVLFGWAARTASAALSWANTEATLRPEKVPATMVARFTFENRTGRTLSIRDVAGSCSCTLVPLAQRTYAPGERGTIEATVEIAKPDPRVTHVVVQLNDPDRSSTTLVIRIEPRMSTTPASP
jgi:hypothetical protein